MNREIHWSSTVTHPQPEAIEVFVSYAPQDEALRDELGKHLSLLKREGVIADWCDRQLTAGSDRASEISDRFNAAHIILLLISPDFLASDDHWNIVGQAMTRHTAAKTCVIPILLRPVDWQSAPFGTLQPLPHNQTPITRWDSRDEAFLHITQHLRTLIPSLKSPSAPPASSAPLPPHPTPHTPHPIPPSLSTYDASTWVGRHPLIATLTQKLRTPLRILAIIGITGIGKTALAERLVVDHLSPAPPSPSAPPAPSSSPTPHSPLPTPHFTRLNFDDRALPHDFITAATTLLPKLGHSTTPDDQKDPQRLLARLLQILRTTPYLVQIDSLEMLLEGDDEQGWTTFKDELWLSFFQQLLAGDDCQSQFILTSQALPEALEIAADRYPRCWHRQELDGLSETEQLEIFQKNGLEPDAIAIDYLKRLGKLYAGHPLVLQVIAKDILDRPFHGNVLQYWQRYQAEFDALERDRPHRRNAPRALQLRVMQRVEQSLQRLPVDARNLLCRSAVYRRPVPETFWLAMLADLPEDRQWNALEVLKSHNLAEEELDVGTNHAVPLLRQHNLIRRVAGDRMQAAPTAWNDAHRTAAHLWQTAYEPALDAPNLETLRGSLEAFHHFCELEDWTAASNIIHKQEFRVQLLTWNCYQEMIALASRLLGKAAPRTELICLRMLGNAAKNLSNYAQAIEYHQRSATIAREIGDCYGEMAALGTLGNAYRSLGNYPQAIESHQQQLTIAREIGDRHGEMAALGNLGLTYDSLGNYPQAIESHQQQLTIAREIGDRHGEGAALGNLGNAYQSLGNYPQAIESHQQALVISREIGDRLGEAQDLGSLGIAYDALGNYPQAIEYQQQSLIIRREIGNRQGEGSALVYWGATLLKLEQYTDAQPHLQASLEIFKALGDRANEAEACLRFAELHHKTGQPDRAREYCDAALALAIELGIPLVKDCEALKVEIEHEGLRSPTSD
jgi:tetratricopeptide (TPR) repeat protein